MISTLLAILICIIILIALSCLGLILGLIWGYRSFFLTPRAKLDREMDPVTPEEQYRRKINRREE